MAVVTDPIALSGPAKSMRRIAEILHVVEEEYPKDRELSVPSGCLAKAQNMADDQNISLAWRSEPSYQSAETWIIRTNLDHQAV